MVLLPVLLPMFGAIVALLLRRHWYAQAVVALLSLLGAAAVSGLLLSHVWQSGQPVVLQIGGWHAPVGITFAADVTGSTFAFLAQAICLCAMLYVLGCRDACVRYPTFIPLFLILAMSLSGAFLTGDLFNLFVFAELLVISTTVLTAISDDETGPEAAYKYFFIATLAAMFLLIACGCLYVSYGTLNLADLANLIGQSPTRPLAGVAMTCLLVTFLIKGAAVPLHFWQPDLYSAAPTPVAAVLSSVVAKFPVYGLLRLTQVLFVADAPTVRWVLIVVGLSGAVFGALAAFGTHNLKRVLAYSSIGQMGFILFAIGLGTPAGLAAAIVFSVNHALIKSAMMMLAGCVASRSVEKTAAFDAISGIGRIMPVAGTLFLLGGMALAGLPPTNGFISKFGVLSAAGSKGSWWPLAVLLPASLISLMYVGRAYTLVWLEPLNESRPPREDGDSLVAPAILITFCLTLGLYAAPLARLAADNAAWLSTPAHYIGAVPVDSDPMSRAAAEVHP